MNASFSFHAPVRSAALILGVALVLASIAVPVAAQETDTARAARDQERNALYKEGVAFAEEGRWEQALQKFRAVVAIRSAPRALVALATAEEQSRRWVEALRTYAKAQADARAQGDEELAKKAGAALASLEPRVPRVAIRLPPGATAALVTLDGAPADPTLESIRVDPGEHRVAATAPGRRPFDKRFRASEGQMVEVNVELAAAEPENARTMSPPPSATWSNVAPAPPEREQATPRPGPPLPALLLGGTGAAAMVIGLVVRANGQADYDDANAACQNHRCASATTVENGDSARRRMLAGTLAAVGGGVALAGAGLWWGLSATATASVGQRGGLSLGIIGRF